MYAAPVTRHMSRFSSLQFFTLPNYDGAFPSWLRIELGILAGRLYFEFEDYNEILSYVQPCEGPARNEKWFAHDAIGFLEEWLAATRNMKDFEHTPMGYVCQGRPLREDHPFFTAANDVDMVNDSSSKPTLRRSLTGVDEDQAASTDGSGTDADDDCMEDE